MRTKKMRGIILAGGRATRLGELTKVISKQMLPVYKQPMIYYPLNTLIKMGIEDILIIVSCELQKQLFKAQLGDGARFGVSLEYIVQNKPNGLAEAFILGETFIGNDDVTLILGDNVFLNHTAEVCPVPNFVYTYKVKNPSAYGVITLDEHGGIDQLVEKPKEFISDLAVVGLYTFTNSAIKMAKTLKPSLRGELEIIDLIRLMHDAEGVFVKEFNGVWFDCGNPDDLLECAEFVRALDKRTNYDIFLKDTL